MKATIAAVCVTALMVSAVHAEFANFKKRTAEVKAVSGQTLQIKNMRFWGMDSILLGRPGREALAIHQSNGMAIGVEPEAIISLSVVPTNRQVTVQFVTTGGTLTVTGAYSALYDDTYNSVPCGPFEGESSIGSLRLLLKDTVTVRFLDTPMPAAKPKAGWLAAVRLKDGTTHTLAETQFNQVREWTGVRPFPALSGGSVIVYERIGGKGTDTRDYLAVLMGTSPHRIGPGLKRLLVVDRETVKATPANGDEMTFALDAPFIGVNGTRDDGVFQFIPAELIAEIAFGASDAVTPQPGTK